jgi:hypothetical protein
MFISRKQYEEDLHKVKVDTILKLVQTKLIIHDKRSDLGSLLKRKIDPTLFNTTSQINEIIKEFNL